MPRVYVTKNFIKLGQAFDLGYTTVSEQGSARSSKTYSNVQWLINRCINHPNTTVSIVRKTLNALKRSVYRDFEDIMNDWGLWSDRQMNKSDYIYRFPNGSWIEFFSCDNEQKMRGPKRQILFVNEANDLNYIEWQQLQMRTTQFTILDYNPSFSEEHWINQVNEEKKTFHFISTYKDNPFLEQKIIDEIESLQWKNKSLWQIYGLGQRAVVEGLVFPEFKIVDYIPREAERRRYIGIDFGYECFSGDTMVMTINGSKRIDEIGSGDYVLTRQGYRKVLRRHNNGIKKVVTKTISVGGQKITISATNNHNFNANGKWKKYEALTKKDRLFILSSLTERFTGDIPTENTQTTTITEGRKTVCSTSRFFTRKFIGSILERYRKATLSTTRISTRSTTTRATCNYYQEANTWRFMRLLKTCLRLWKRAEKMALRKRTGMIDEKSSWPGCIMIPNSANIAERSLLRQIHTNVFAQKNAITSGNMTIHKTILSLFANIVANHSKATNTSNQNVAAKNVHISCQPINEIKQEGVRTCNVFDLEVDGVHEYFANGILVHNCDPTAIVEVSFFDKRMYIKELCYKTHMLTSDIINELKKIRWEPEIISESADPRLVDEIYNAGLNINAVHKFGGSIMAGITKMQEYEICVTSDSTNAIKELRNYTYRQDKEGKWLNVPIDAYNHVLDSVRYIVLEKILGIGASGMSASEILGIVG